MGINEIVRCKDCFFRFSNNYCMLHERKEDDDGFCSHGTKVDDVFKHGDDERRAT